MVAAVAILALLALAEAASASWASHLDPYTDIQYILDEMPGQGYVGVLEESYTYAEVTNLFEQASKCLSGSAAGEAGRVAGPNKHRPGQYWPRWQGRPEHNLETVSITGCEKKLFP
ncbi:MAG: hypothetical protein LRS48_06555 [Desulfurococcales archaeon]|nr:hypothetical protein [Desulfurococcales archaeon]